MLTEPACVSRKPHAYNQPAKHAAQTLGAWLAYKLHCVLLDTSQTQCYMGGIVGMQEQSSFTLILQEVLQIRSKSTVVISLEIVLLFILLFTSSTLTGVCKKKKKKSPS